MPQQEVDGFSPPCRFQCHALQEKPDACRALLQPGSAPGGADGRPAADGFSPVAGEDAGRQRQQVRYSPTHVQRVSLRLLKLNYTR